MNLFEKAGLVDESNDEIVKTGITRLENLLLDFLFASIISGILGNFLVGILFEFCYMVLRIYAGGYHASTPRKCLCFTYGSTLVCMIFIFILPMTKYIFAVLIAVFIGTIFLTTPIQSENKPLCNTEKKVYRRNSVFIAVAETGLFALLVLWEKYLFAKTVFVSMALVVTGLMIEIAKKKVAYFQMKENNTDS